jgi:transcriptional regulator with XRE-family HTH domain
MASTSKATRKQIGTRIQQARVRAGMTQNQLAARCGLVDGQGIWRYETGSSVPRGDRLIMIAAALGVSAEWLMSGAEGAADAAEPHAASPVVAAYLERDPTARLLSPEQVSQLQTMDFGEVSPSISMVRAIALCIVDDDHHEDATEIRRGAGAPAKRHAS